MEPIDTGYGGAPGPDAYGYADHSAGGYPDGGYPAAPAEPPRGSGGRTAALALIALLALALLVLAGYLVFSGRGGEPDGGSGGGAVASSSTASTVSSMPASSTETTTSSTTVSSTTAGPAVREVSYRLTGTGNLIGVRYTTQSGDQVVAATGVPWSVRAPVSGPSAELTGIVVGGRVTCTITVDGEELATATSNGGTIECRASLPD